MSNRNPKRNTNEYLRTFLTREMLVEVEETFRAAAESKEIMPLSRLPLALKALGMEVPSVESLNIPPIGIDVEKFIEIVTICMKTPNWAANEMLEAFAIFDKDSSGFIDPRELGRVFAQAGESLLETELEDQLKEVDIDGDLQVAVAEFYNLVTNTKGSDFAFDDAIL